MLHNIATWKAAVPMDRKTGSFSSEAGKRSRDPVAPAQKEAVPGAIPAV